MDAKKKRTCSDLHIYTLTHTQTHTSSVKNKVNYHVPVLRVCLCAYACVCAWLCACVHMAVFFGLLLFIFLFMFLFVCFLWC